MLRTLAVAIALLLPRTAGAGPYMTGLGNTDPRISFDHLFARFSGPLLVGTDGTALRVGLAAIHFADERSLARPRWMVSLDVFWPLGSATEAIVGASIQKGVGPLLIGGGAGVQIRETQSGYVVSPEISLPIRLRAHALLAPSIVLFARADLVASRRDVFDNHASRPEHMQPQLDLQQLLLLILDSFNSDIHPSQVASHSCRASRSRNAAIASSHSSRSAAVLSRHDQPGALVRVHQGWWTPAARIASIVLARIAATSSSLSSRSSPLESSSRSNAGSISSLAGSFEPIVRSHRSARTPSGGRSGGQPELRSNARGRPVRGAR